MRIDIEYLGLTAHCDYSADQDSESLAIGSYTIDDRDQVEVEFDGLDDAAIRAHLLREADWFMEKAREEWDSAREPDPDRYSWTETGRH